MAAAPSVAALQVPLLLLLLLLLLLVLVAGCWIALLLFSRLLVAGWRYPDKDWICPKELNAPIVRKQSNEIDVPVLLYPFFSPT